MIRLDNNAVIIGVMTSAEASRATSSGEPATTRELLVELAAEVFADEGYAAASVRDLGRRAGVTSGAIYGNFRGKADLLAEAVDARLAADGWTLPDDDDAQSLLDFVADQFAHSKGRAQLISLLLEGAVAARVDGEVKRRLQKPIARRLNDSAAAFEARRSAEGLDPAVDVDAAVKMLWSIEIGLRVLAALGIAAPAPESGSDVVRHFLQGLQSTTPRRPSRAAKAGAKRAGTKKAAAKATKSTKAAASSSSRAAKKAPSKAGALGPARSAARAAKKALPAKANPRKRAR